MIPLLLLFYFHIFVFLAWDSPPLGLFSFVELRSTRMPPGQEVFQILTVTRGLRSPQGVCAAIIQPKTVLFETRLCQLSEH